RITGRPAVLIAMLVGNGNRCVSRVTTVGHSGQHIDMEAHSVFLGILERPATPALFIEQPLVNLACSKPIAYHELDAARVRLAFVEREFADEVDIVFRFNAAANRSDHGAQPERALRIDAGLAQTTRVRSVFQPLPDSVISVHRVAILTGRDVQIACDLLEKLGVLVDTDLHEPSTPYSLGT